jgi:potassium-dependent mechanosensitive channel
MAYLHRKYRHIFSGCSSLLGVLFLYVFISFSSVSLVSAADQVQVNEWLPQAVATIKKQEQILKWATPENVKVDRLSEQIKRINPVKSQAQQCIVDTETLILKVTEDLATLGDVATKEAAEVVKKRRSLTGSQKSLDKQLSSCKLLLLQSQDLIKTINELQQGVLAEQLSARTPHIINVIAENFKNPFADWGNSIEFLKAQYKLKLLSAQEFISLILLITVGVVSGIYYGRILRVISLQSAEPSDSVSAFILAVRTSLARTLFILLPVGMVATYLSIILPLSPLPFITKLVYLLGIYLSLIVLIDILLNPAYPAPVYLTKPDLLSRRLARHLKLLLTLGLIASFLLTGEFKASLSETAYYMNRSILNVLFITNLIIILWLLRLFSWAILSRGLRIFLSIVLIGSLVAELAGYRNLSFFVLGGVIATAVSLGLTMFVYYLLKDLCDGLDEGRLVWEENIRDRIGLEAGVLVPGLIWIRIIIFAGLWGGFAILALNIWKLDDPWLAIIISYFTEGFRIGSLQITPTLLIGGILAFAITLHLTRYIKNHVLPHTLKYTNLDRGAREAVSSLVGYVGVAAALLIALSITGVQMQNIAIIAGALSVGIGFGLQNIVNNFISGIILLFERPIRRGDWIVTGDTEGYVKAINIRSTQIETFDRADVIVPNSELITAKVTNWMLRDPYGRISIPIGVGYGSDVEKVHRILLDIAQNHPMVMSGDSVISNPKVLFRDFGDNSMNFELRCFIHDIDQRLNVISEINFSIVKNFRSEGVEIPFPQRVVTIANWENEEKE